MLDFFKPAPAVKCLPPDEIKKKYPIYRFQVFISIFIGYAAYYLTRSNFPLAAPYLIKDLGFTKGHIGLVRSALGISYGLSKFIMGNVSDRCNPRYFMAFGLIASGLISFAFPYAGSIAVMFILMLVNGWFQGMGWPPCGRTMTHWFSVSERGTKMSIWNVAHNIGGGLIALIVSASMTIFAAWQSIFYVPGTIAILIGIFVMIFLRDTPQSVGLPPIEEYTNDYPIAAKGIDAEKEMTGKEILFKYVLNNRLVWMVALANVFVYVVRYGVVDWAPTYLTEVKHLSHDSSRWGFFLFEYAGIPGTLLAGWISDKFFQGRRSPVGFFYMFLVMISVLVYWLNPVGQPTIDIIALSAIGFLIYGPVMLIGVSALDMVPKKAAGTAAGFTGLFGYLFGTVGASYGLGRVVQSFGWNAGFYILAGSCVLAMILLLFTWNVKPSCDKDDKECIPPPVCPAEVDDTYTYNENNGQEETKE